MDDGNYVQEEAFFPKQLLGLDTAGNFMNSQMHLSNIIKNSNSTEELYKALWFFFLHYITYLNIKLFNDCIKINLENIYFLFK